MSSGAGVSDEAQPVRYHGLSDPVGRVRLAGEYELNWSIRIGEEPKQPIRIVQQ